MISEVVPAIEKLCPGYLSSQSVSLTRVQERLEEMYGGNFLLIGEYRTNELVLASVEHDLKIWLYQVKIELEQPEICQEELVYATTKLKTILDGQWGKKDTEQIEQAKLAQLFLLDPANSIHTAEEDIEKLIQQKAKFASATQQPTFSILDMRKVPPIPNSVNIRDDYLTSYDVALDMVGRLLPMLKEDEKNMISQKIYSCSPLMEQKAREGERIIGIYLREAREVALDKNKEIPPYYDRASPAFELIYRIRTAIKII
ncbi:MAG: hypothetical protein HGA85_09330 [Nanoarchaeota archaeon]|nr:hypothetical protein [Nanoarchaeota archaeon]